LPGINGLRRMKHQRVGHVVGDDPNRFARAHLSVDPSDGDRKRFLGRVEQLADISHHGRAQTAPEQRTALQEIRAESDGADHHGDPRLPAASKSSVRAVSAMPSGINGTR